MLYDAYIIMHDFYVTRGALRVESTFGQCVLFADVLLFQPFRTAFLLSSNSDLTLWLFV